MRHLTTFVAVTCLMVVAPPTWIAAQEEADSATEFEIGVLFGLRHYWADGKDLTVFTIPGDEIGGYGAAFLRGNSSGPYLLGHAGARFRSNFTPRLSFSGGLGAWTRFGPTFVPRTEARYRRWLASEDYRLARVRPSVPDD